MEDFDGEGNAIGLVEVRTNFQKRAERVERIAALALSGLARRDRSHIREYIDTAIDYAECLVDEIDARYPE